VPATPLKKQVAEFCSECFKDISFGHHLLPIEPSSSSKMQQTLQGEALDLTASSLPTTKLNKPPASQIAIEIPDVRARARTLQTKIKNIQIGDVLSVTKDELGSVWKDEVSRWNAGTQCWYVYVQGVHESKNGQFSFDGLWCYSAADTMCGLMKVSSENVLSATIPPSSNC
jgi:DNA (cytosine-5)-methyltransferase 1